jgi:hypothetical protein
MPTGYAWRSAAVSPDGRSVLSGGGATVPPSAAVFGQSREKTLDQLLVEKRRLTTRFERASV